MSKLPVAVFFMALCSLGFSAEDRNDLCQEQMVDLGFLLDSSGSVKHYFEKEKNFVQKIASHFNIKENGTHAGVITFSHDADVSIKFTDYLTTSSFNKAIEKLSYHGYHTRIEKALKKSHRILYTEEGNARPDSKKILFLITDGRQEPNHDRNGNLCDPVKEAEILHAKEVQIYAVAIGARVDLPQLKKITKDPKRVYTARNFDELITDEFVRNVTKKLCLDLKAPVKGKPKTETPKKKDPKEEIQKIAPLKIQLIQPEIHKMEQPKANKIKGPCQCGEGSCDCPCGRMGCGKKPFYLTIFQGSNNYVSLGQKVTQTGIGSSAVVNHPARNLPSTSLNTTSSNQEIANYIKSLIPHYASLNKSLKNLLVRSLKNKINGDAPSKK